MRRTPRTLGLVALAAALVLPACSGGEDEPDAGSAPTAGDVSAESGTEPTPQETVADPTGPEADERAGTATTDVPADEPVIVTLPDDTLPAVTLPVVTLPDDADEPGTSPDEDVDRPLVDGDTIVVSDLADLPRECVDQVADMLREIEPVVSQVDWDTATLDELDALMLELDDEFTALEDADEASGCSRYEFGDDADSFAAMLELAEREAPGAVGWLTFLQTFFAGTPGSDTGANPAVPDDCDGAIAYLEAVIADGGTLGSLPVAELAAVSQALDVVATACDPDTLSEFFDRDDVADFLS